MKYRVFCYFFSFALLFSRGGSIEATQFCRQGWYVNVFGGGNSIDCERVDGAKLKFKTGYFAGGAVGFKIMDPYYFFTRIEAECAYRRCELDRLEDGSETRRVSGHIYSTSYMVNFLKDFNLNTPVIPYFGLGFGYAESDLKAGDHQIHGKWNLEGRCVQGLAGLCCPLTSQMDVNVEYRLFRLRLHDEEHSFGISVKHFF